MLNNLIHLSITSLVLSTTFSSLAFIRRISITSIAIEVYSANLVIGQEIGGLRPNICFGHQFSQCGLLVWVSALSVPTVKFFLDLPRLRTVLTANKLALIVSCKLSFCNIGAIVLLRQAS